MSVQNDCAFAPRCFGGPTGGVIETRNDAFLIAYLTSDYSSIVVISGKSLSRRAEGKFRHHQMRRQETGNDKREGA